MITKCTCTKEAGNVLRERVGLEASSAEARVEIEFREVPYFIVSRSKDRWDPAKGDINAVSILAATEDGLIADPDSHPRKVDGSDETRRTLIPWANIISLTVT